MIEYVTIRETPLPYRTSRVTAAHILAAAVAPVVQAVPAQIPGAALGVVTTAGDRAVEVFGLAQREPNPVPIGRATWFDLASLTKVLFTTPSILHLVSRGDITLDCPLTRAIPDLRQYHRDAPERRLTFRECLSHQTHLPAVEPLYTYGLDPNTARAFILQRVWQAGPPVYSDINFMLLGIAIERLKGMQADRSGITPRIDLASGAIGDRGDRTLHLAWPRDTRRSARRECLRARWRCWPRRPFRDDRRGPRCGAASPGRR